MAMNPPVMEMKMILAMLSQSISVINDAQRALEIQNRDLVAQSDWLKGEISKALEEAPTPTTTDLDILWERIKPHWKGDMGPAFVFVNDIAPIFKPEPAEEAPISVAEMDRRFVKALEEVNPFNRNR